MPSLYLTGGTESFSWQITGLSGAFNTSVYIAAGITYNQFTVGGVTSISGIVSSTYATSSWSGYYTPSVAVSYPAGTYTFWAWCQTIDGTYWPAGSATVTVSASVSTYIVQALGPSAGATNLLLDGVAYSLPIATKTVTCGTSVTVSLTLADGYTFSYWTAYLIDTAGTSTLLGTLTNQTQSISLPAAYAGYIVRLIPTLELASVFKTGQWYVHNGSGFVPATMYLHNGGWATPDPRLCNT